MSNDPEPRSGQIIVKMLFRCNHRIIKNPIAKKISFQYNGFDLGSITDFWYREKIQQRWKPIW